MKRFLSPLLAAGVLLSIGAASAAPATFVAGAYSGHTSQPAHGHKLTISFTVVKPAQGGAYVTSIAYKAIDKCSSHVSITTSHTQAGHITISAGGNFTDSHDYGLHNRNHIKITGHLTGKSAGGTIADDNVAPPPACHGKSTWTAAR